MDKRAFPASSGVGVGGGDGGVGGGGGGGGSGGFFSTGRLMDTWIFFLFVAIAGTKWCGSGNVADGPDDLGVFAMTDACCREHDNCKDIIEPMQTKYGLTNSAFYTRLHCSCDERFYDCLHSSEELVSAKVGFLYFSVLDTKCFREDYPIVGCKRHSLIPRRCLEYELDESQPKMYQWFDVPTYFQNDHRMVMAGRHIRSLDPGTSVRGFRWKSITRDHRPLEETSYAYRAL